jgi:hypothetical protein
MLEGMLLLLLALGGGQAGSAAAAVPTPTTPDTVVGVWRGTWAAASVSEALPVEAIVTPPAKDGQLIALFATGVGRARRTLRMSGRFDADGVQFVMPGGGTLHLAIGTPSRLIGIVRGAGNHNPLSGDGTLELARVRR